MKYAKECVHLSEQYARLTGHKAFLGVTGGKYLFASATIENGPDAVEHMDTVLAKAARGRYQDIRDALGTTEAYVAMEQIIGKELTARYIERS